MSEDKKIEDNKELDEKELNNVDGGCFQTNHYWCPDCHVYSLTQRCNKCGRKIN